ncbi:hypothetical protein QAD02_007119 [Eretmocerus hayati]|uniref:Uncharacterized protein n=1 Tax=Eretmocerus hayati TaxID=131215 RepID=A0ACC2N571_9HYME|nr:hypothetical protein QAD02_007119 [Eretmocerus hayati]
MFKYRIKYGKLLELARNRSHSGEEISISWKNRKTIFSTCSSFFRLKNALVIPFHMTNTNSTEPLNENFKRPTPATTSSEKLSPAPHNQDEIIPSTGDTGNKSQGKGDGFILPRKRTKRSKKPKVEELNEVQIELKVITILEPVKPILEKLPSKEYVSFNYFNEFMKKSWGQPNTIEIARSIMPEVNIDNLVKTLEFAHTIVTESQDKARLTRLKNKLKGDPSDSEDTDSSQGQSSKSKSHLSA